MRHHAASISLAAAALVLAPMLAAQDVPSVEQFAKQVEALRGRLRLKALRMPTEEDKAALAKPERELRDFVAWIEQQKGLTLRHYVTACEAFAMWYPEHAQRIAEAGAKQLPESREAQVHLGDVCTVTSFSLPVGAARLARLQSAEAAYRKALTCKPDTWNAHAGLAQSLASLGRGDEALAEMHVAMRDPEGKTHFAAEAPCLLLQAGRGKEALELLRAPGAFEKIAASAGWWTKVDHLVLVVRATAMTNDAAATQAAIGELRAAESSSRTVVEAADALAYVGKKAEAVQLLAQRAAIGKGTDQAWSESAYAQTAAAMELVWNADDFSPGGPLRAALTKALDHHFVVEDGGKQVDLADSPVLMCKLLQDASKEPQLIKGWANQVLFVLCARAATTHQPKGLEQTAIAKLATSERMPGVEDVPAWLLEFRRLAGAASAAGVLTGLRALDKLEAAGGAPKSPAKR